MPDPEVGSVTWTAGLQRCFWAFESLPGTMADFWVGRESPQQGSDVLAARRGPFVRALPPGGCFALIM